MIRRFGDTERAVFRVNEKKRAVLIKVMRVIALILAAAIVAGIIVQPTLF